MLPARHSLVLWEGATYRQQLTLLQFGGLTPLDLTGYTAILTVRQAPEGAVLLTLSSSGPGIVLGGSAGTLWLYVTASQTQSLGVRGAVYQLSITDTASTGDTNVIMWGSFAIQGIG